MQNTAILVNFASKTLFQSIMVDLAGSILIGQLSLLMEELCDLCIDEMAFVTMQACRIHIDWLANSGDYCMIISISVWMKLQLR